jgi:hypothetical protein
MIVRGVVPLVAALVASTAEVSAFAPSNLFRVKPIQHKCSQTPSRLQPLCMSNQFDISRPVFDLLALRSVRGDAVIRYDALNQSEPLRIILFGILALTCLAAPSLSEAVGYDEMGTPATVASILAAVASAGLLVRECTRRAKQLTRIEKELNTELLPIRLPTNALADMPFTKAATLKDLRGLSTPPRIIAMSGTKAKLTQALKGLSILGRRLQQASVYVVVIPTDGSKASDWQLASTANPTWLADSYQDSVWQTYMDELLEIDNGSSRPSFRWFGLNSSGRSFGSGDEEIPQWLEVLGQHLRPTQLLDESDAASTLIEADVASLLGAQEKFYSALTTGNLETMTEINSDTASPQISEVSRTHTKSCLREHRHLLYESQHVILFKNVADNCCRWSSRFLEGLPC